MLKVLAAGLFVKSIFIILMRFEFLLIQRDRRFIKLNLTYVPKFVLSSDSDICFC